MGIYAELLPAILSALYETRDWFLLNVPLVGDAVASAVQWVINALPLP